MREIATWELGFAIAIPTGILCLFTAVALSEWRARRKERRRPDLLTPEQYARWNQKRMEP